MGVLLPAFVATQIFLPKTATIPPRILKYRSVAAGLCSTIFIGSSQYIYGKIPISGNVISRLTLISVYYIPIWFQSVKGVSAVESGIRLLPLMLGTVVASISGGFLNQKIGYYTPLGIAGSCIMAVGAGLLTTLEVGTGSDKWIGYQVMYGFGMGFCFQTPNLATQTVLPKPDVPMGIALMFFGQLLGAAVFVSVGENVLGSQLLQRISGIPGFDKSLITSGGATSLLDSVPQELRGTVLIAYKEALRKVFQIGLILSCLAVLSTALLEWKSVLKQPEAGVNAEKSATADEKKTEQTV